MFSLKIALTWLCLAVSFYGYPDTIAAFPDRDVIQDGSPETVEELEGGEVNSGNTAVQWWWEGRYFARGKWNTVNHGRFYSQAQAASDGAAWARRMAQYNARIVRVYRLGS